MINIKAVKATSMKDKMRGLMFKDIIAPLYFETRFGVHTFFVKHPIIVLILNSENRVAIKKTLKPWRIFFWNPKYFRVLELPTNYPIISKIKFGTKCSLQLSNLSS